MIAIADSGSTKTDWIFASGKDNYYSFRSIGLHPLRIQELTVKQELRQFTRHTEIFPQISRLYFYGAGCGNSGRTTLLEQSLKEIFPAAEILIYPDMLGSCFSASAGKPSVCAILGTGSNSALFDGYKIIHQQISIGHILGDEGSGSDLGRRLLRKLLYKKLPAALLSDFQTQYSKSDETIIRETYASPTPNRYLAGYCSFIYHHIDYPEMQTIVKESFDSFFRAHLTEYPDIYKLPVHFHGSIAFFFQDFILKSLEQYGLTPGTIERSPMDGLIRYHLGE
ncbi:MAG: hypothetical protein K9I34_04545 [Bacteroidales bacterium]|nr:hypothetical protein [Bacteroidales bacterium]